MANYYYVTIKSEKINQDIANEILQEIVKSNYIRYFSFHDGYLHFNSRGLPDITELLTCYGFNDKEDKIEIEDEFENAYRTMMSPEESVKRDLNKVLESIQRWNKHDYSSDKLEALKKNIENIVRG